MMKNILFGMFGFSLLAMVLLSNVAFASSQSGEVEDAYCDTTCVVTLGDIIDASIIGRGEIYFPVTMKPFEGLSSTISIDGSQSEDGAYLFKLTREDINEVVFVEIPSGATDEQAIDAFKSAYQKLGMSSDKANEEAKKTWEKIKESKKQDDKSEFIDNGICPPGALC